MTTESPSLRLTVWRPSKWNRDYLNLSQGGEAKSEFFVEEVYSWETDEDLYGSITAVETQKIQEGVQQFDPANFDLDAKQPAIEFSETFSVKRIETLIKLIDTALTTPDGANWSTSKTAERLSSSDRLQIRLHPLLALRHHLQWIYDTFSGVPYVSITIR